MATQYEMQDIAKDICITNGLLFLGEIGQGTFKETYCVADANEQLALKIYKPGFLEERNKREIDAMVRCNHISIAKLLFVGNHNSGDKQYLYVLEEYLGGGTLENRLRENGILDPKYVVYLGSNLISAVAHIQSHDLVHRDLKPNNILFRTEEDIPVITDFGIVRDLQKESLTFSWETRGPGTYLFSSPEQINNEKEIIDWRSDQFSLGIVLSICMFGIHPYGSDYSKIIDAVASYGSLTTEFQDLVKKVKFPVLMKMVNPWPANRYRFPMDLQEDWNKQGGYVQ